MIFQFSVQGSQGNIEQAGGFGFVAIGMSKHFSNVEEFRFGEVEGDGGRWVYLGNLLEFKWQVFYPKHPVVHEDDTAFNHVFQFADIAGPGIFLQGSNKVWFDMLEFLVGFLGKMLGEIPR